MKHSIYLSLLITFLLFSYYFLPQSTFATSEEQAIYNINQGTLPENADQLLTPKDQSAFDSILKTIQNFSSGLQNLFQKPPDQPGKLFIESATLSQTSIPEEVRPKSDSSNPIDWISNQFKGFLGGSTGVYGVALPQEVQSGDIKGSEQAYEKAHFPEGIRPVTGQ